MPPNLSSTIFEDLVAHTSKSEVSGKFPHERIIVLGALKQQHVHIPPHPSPTPPVCLGFHILCVYIPTKYVSLFFFF